MERIYKLKYESKEVGITDLIEKGILTNDSCFSLPVHAVVDLTDGKFDLMIEDIVLEDESLKKWDFGTNLIEPQTPDHTFAGYDIPTTIEEGY